MLTLKSPAKINLFLQIVGKRPDGYHNIASLFQTIDLMDTLSIQLSYHADRLSCSDPTIPTDHSNLVLKAVNLFRKKTGLEFFVDIHLEKKIPNQAGLGGGSGNAATTLWALNHLHGHRFSLEQPSQWGVEIGADVPFFLSEGTAFCTGIGENVYPLPKLGDCQLLLVKPSEGLSTPLVYKNLKLDHLPKRHPEESLKNYLAGRQPCFNDMEHSAFALMPALQKLKENLLASGFSQVLMSGSGTCFFCLGEGTPHLEGLWSRPVRFINRYPGCWFM